MCPTNFNPSSKAFIFKSINFSFTFFLIIYSQLICSKFIDLTKEPNNITFHYEACKNKEELLKFVNLIKENNCKVGVSIKPNTEAEKIYDILPYIHTVLVMTVEPGQGGQKLIKETIEKIKKLKKYIQENNLDTEIEADGGINLENVDELKNAGCDIIVAGTSIINSKDFKDTIRKMK